MGKGCITVTKYFLFLFNLLFFVSNWVYLSVVIIWFSCTCMAHTHTVASLFHLLYIHKNYEPSDSVWFISFIFYVAPQISDDAESIDSI